MLKLIVLVCVVACAYGGVMPKSPASHSEVKNESPSVKSMPLHPEHHQTSVASHNAADVKAEGKHEDKAKSVAHHEHKSEAKKEEPHHHGASAKTVHQEHHGHYEQKAHHEVPVKVHVADAKSVPVAKGMNSHENKEKVENVKTQH